MNIPDKITGRFHFLRLECGGFIPNALTAAGLNDYRSKKFPAGSLNDRQWRDLREALREEKIVLRG